jgi:hypothetical protein
MPMRLMMSRSEEDTGFLVKFEEVKVPFEEVEVRV